MNAGDGLFLLLLIINYSLFLFLLLILTQKKNDAVTETMSIDKNRIAYSRIKNIAALDSAYWRDCIMQ